MSKSSVELHVFQSTEGKRILDSQEADYYYSNAGDLFRIRLVQCASTRLISISADGNDIDRCYHVFQYFEHLLALFDGCYWSIDRMEIEDDDGKDYDGYIEETINHRLGLYKSADICYEETKSLVDLCAINFDVIFTKWVELKNKLQLVHPMVMYCVAQTGITVDLKCASLIQTFAPLTEMIHNDYDETVPLKVTGKVKEPELRGNLETIINRYGNSFFFLDRTEEEKKNEIDKLRNTRNTLMHVRIKPDQILLNPNECIGYTAKLFLLFRVVVFTLLEIPEEVYMERVKELGFQWENWLKNQ